MTNKKILIITQHSLFDWKHNMNAYQRVLFGSQHADIYLLTRRKRVVSEELSAKVHVHKAWVHWRPGFVVYAILYAAYLRPKRLHAVITEPSGFVIVGFVAKYLLRTAWVLDVWDRPRWRPGGHEGPPSRWSDRLVFWLMKRADLYILSVLRGAARDVNPDPSRCINVRNALDLSQCAKTPVDREDEDRTLRLAYLRSRFSPNMGLDVLVEATELATIQGAELEVHLVGQLLRQGRELLQESPVAERFVVHGTIDPLRRTELFRSMHVGLVPYPAFEDLSYIYPIKVLEYLSQGIPVIASDLPGLAVMVRHRYNGLLIRPGDPSDLAEAMVLLWRDRTLWSALAAHALESIREFDAEEKNAIIFHRIVHGLTAPGRVNEFGDARRHG